ncbi:MAG: hypothetical protein WC469_04715 [Candidatus Omnitrophota bacterium]
MTMQRVVTFLDRDEVDLLDKIGKDALFSTGLKVSRAKILAWLIDFIKDINVSGEGIKSEADFEKRIIQKIGEEAPHLPRN